MPTAPPAIATADGAVPTLPTATVRGLELLLPGTYTGIAGGANAYSPARLAGIAQAAEELRGYLTPTVKIGHGSQALLEGAEMPNAGIIDNVYVRGTGPDARLVVDLASVPAKIAALIKSGNLRARSAELLFDTTHNGKRYDAVLTGMALLGTSQPAVKGLNDVLALYQSPDESALIALTESARESQTVELADAPTDPSDYAYVPDPDKPSTWKLRIDDAAHISAAAAALGPGFRGQKVDIPAADRAAVVAKVRAAWKKANPDKGADDMPEGIKLAAPPAKTDTSDNPDEPVLSPSQQAADAAAECTNPAHADMPAGIHKKLHMPKTAKHSARASARVALSGPAYSEIQNAVQDALEDAYPYVYTDYGASPSGNNLDTPSPWIECLYDDSVIVWDQDHDQLWSIPYTYDADSDTAELGEPARCRLVPQLIAGAAMAAPRAEAQLAEAGADYAQHFAGLESALADVGTHLNGLANQKGVGPARMMHKELAGKVAAMKGRLVQDSAAQDAGDGGVITEGNTSAETPLDVNKKPGGGARLQQEESMNDTEIRALLSLGPNDDIKQALIGLTARKVELSDHQALLAERDALLAEKSRSEAAALVDEAINAGKLVPKMRDWAVDLATSDKQSFEVYLSNASGFQMWSGAGEVGVSGEQAASHAPSPTALRMAQSMGIDPASLNDTRSTKDKYFEQLKAKGVEVFAGSGKGGA